MRVLGRLALWLVGLVLAIPAAAVALGVGLFADPQARALVGAVGLVAFEALFAEAFGGGRPDLLAEELLLAAWGLSLVVVVAPPVVASAIGEIAGARSLAFYGGLTGLLAASIPWLARGGLGSGAAAAAEGRLTALLFLSGAVAGLVYWASAGRTAGRAPEPAA